MRVPGIIKRISLDLTPKPSGSGKLKKLRLLEKLWWIASQYQLNIIRMVSVWGFTCTLHVTSLRVHLKWHCHAFSKPAPFLKPHICVIHTNLTADVPGCVMPAQTGTLRSSRAKMDDAATWSIIWHSAASGTSVVTGLSGCRAFLQDPGESFLKARWPLKQCATRYGLSWAWCCWRIFYVEHPNKSPPHSEDLNTFVLICRWKNK